MWCLVFLYASSVVAGLLIGSYWNSKAIEHDDRGMYFGDSWQFEERKAFNCDLFWVFVPWPATLCLGIFCMWICAVFFACVWVTSKVSNGVKFINRLDRASKYIIKREKREKKESKQ